MLRTCLFSLNETDLRAPMRDGRERRRARGDRPRRRLAQGAQAPRRRRGLRAAGAHDVADRRVKDLPEARGAGRSAAVGAAAGPSACRSREAAGRVAAEAAPQRRRPAARSTARRWTATRCARPTRPRRPRCAWPARSAGGRDGDGHARARHGACGITTGAAIPPGADAVLQSSCAEVADGTRRADRGVRRRAAHPPPRRGRPRGRRARAAPASR